MAGHARLLRPDEFSDAARVVAQGMLGSVADDVIDQWVANWDEDRAHGAFADDGRVVGVARWFDSRMAVSGGALPAGCVTAVAVLATHRRQGHLTSLMEAQLQALSDAEIPVALLAAAEWPIYGRFGYGPAIEACEWQIDTASVRFRDPPVGTVEIVTPAELRPVIEAVHDQRWSWTDGAVKRQAFVWDAIAGVVRWPQDKDDPGLFRGAIWRDSDGAVGGAVAYRVEEAWTHGRPDGKANISLLVGATRVADRELWRHLCSLDWVTRVTAADRDVGDALPHCLLDGRAVTQTFRWDAIWARILDVPAALGARRSSFPGRVVVEVADDRGFAAGRWQLDLGPEGASVTSTTSSADLSLPIGALSAAFLGGTGVRKLHEAGWIDEEASGAVDRLHALLATSSPPWSPTMY